MITKNKKKNNNTTKQQNKKTKKQIGGARKWGSPSTWFGPRKPQIHTPSKQIQRNLQPMMLGRRQSNTKPVNMPLTPKGAKMLTFQGTGVDYNSPTHFRITVKGRHFTPETQAHIKDVQSTIPAPMVRNKKTGVSEQLTGQKLEKYQYKIIQNALKAGHVANKEMLKSSVDAVQSIIAETY